MDVYKQFTVKKGTLGRYRVRLLSSFHFFLLGLICDVLPVQLFSLFYNKYTASFCFRRESSRRSLISSVFTP